MNNLMCLSHVEPIHNVPDGLKHFDKHMSGYKKPKFDL